MALLSWTPKDAVNGTGRSVLGYRLHTHREVLRGIPSWIDARDGGEWPRERQHSGLKIQLYCAIIAYLLSMLYTGRRPSIGIFEVVCFYLSGWASLKDLEARIAKTPIAPSALPARLVGGAAFDATLLGACMAATGTGGALPQTLGRRIGQVGKLIPRGDSNCRVEQDWLCPLLLRQETQTAVSPAFARDTAVPSGLRVPPRGVEEHRFDSEKWPSGTGTDVKSDVGRAESPQSGHSPSADVLKLAEQLAKMPPEALAALRALFGSPSSKQ